MGMKGMKSLRSYRLIVSATAYVIETVIMKENKEIVITSLQNWQYLPYTRILGPAWPTYAILIKSYCARHQSCAATHSDYIKHYTKYPSIDTPDASQSPYRCSG